MTGVCPHVVGVSGIVSMKGCKLTENKGSYAEGTSNKTRYQLCSPSCYEGDYTKCPVYRDWGGETK